jgi:hypothetical protein
VVGSANEDTLEQECRQQTVLFPFWDIFSCTHWGYEWDPAYGPCADTQILQWQVGKGTLP